MVEVSGSVGGGLVQAGTDGSWWYRAVVLEVKTGSSGGK